MTDVAAADAPRLSAKQNTKVETLAEAIENLISTTVARMPLPTGASPAALLETFQSDARSALRSALQQFLVPALHLVEDGPRQPYMPDVPREERVLCAACNRHFICADTKCPHWHAAIKAAVNKPVAPEVQEPEGDNVA